VAAETVQFRQHLFTPQKKHLLFGKVECPHFSGTGVFLLIFMRSDGKKRRATPDPNIAPSSYCRAIRKSFGGATQIGSGL